MTANADIWPASDADLATLVAVLGERHFFTDRLARQQRGGGVLLVAWLEGQPVGEVFLECEPAEEPEVRRHLSGVPRLDHLEVLGPFQGRGIGTALIRAAEATARQLGTSRSRLAWGWTTPRLGGCTSGSAMASAVQDFSLAHGLRRSPGGNSADQPGRVTPASAGNPERRRDANRVVQGQFAPEHWRSAARAELSGPTGGSLFGLPSRYRLVSIQGSLTRS